ncbi:MULTISPECIES: class I SAM-dependent methyltransferase [unclassified Ensifer]|uniref:class I SAM-dependent methyltransferase n=1 Tax=unclassified Ensifer TaxID=2633371 RepID=UPI000813AE5A|nr:MULTISPECIES: class I SAM-dependent methyltransferase [unclassified Ensifer]OCP20656.1 SAM-dependent methyltransferase [Ensifer sp. LC384]OCP20694.1 SAM-dependent methyltransferase [Ensifer sp. LC54]
MAQNIYDKPEFFEGYSQLGRSVHGLDGAAEWPAIRAALPDLQGSHVVDLGCGFGWFSRFAREQGAARVLGLDLSENMIARARRDTADPAIEYGIADLDHLTLEDGAFDLAYSSLAFHYVEDFDRLIQAIHNALMPGSHLVFTIEHPIYMASLTPGWQVGENGEKRWPVDHYSVEGRRTTDWLAKGVVKYHRTIGTTLNALMRGGFAIRHVEEWHPTPAQIAANPDLAEEMERPMILIVDAQR